MSIEQLLSIALATFITEDLTCIGTGLLVAQGRVSFVPGTLACVAGIFAGDLLLFLSGRFAGRPALRFVSPEKMKAASDWLSSKGMAVVFLSRFAPGLRLPTYIAAGLLKTRFWRFTGYFLAAAAIWTPLLVGASALLGARIPRASLALWLGPILAAAFFLKQLAALGFRYRTRRALVGFVQRKIRWEFWPAWAAYIPVVPQLVRLAWKYRSATLFTATNPGIPSSGFVGESKSWILGNLRGAEGSVADFAVIPGAIETYARVRQSMEFLERNDLVFPVVLKPDVGERGSGVAVVRSQGELESYLKAATGDTIIQAYIPGLEFGVFYYRYPGEPQGRIFSITEKRFPAVIGDGRSTLERLILGDPRAVCLASVYLKTGRRTVQDVPLAGESVRLVELGSHCRGAVFLDGERLKTEALEQTIDRISQCYPGFYFGRYDIRAHSVDAFQRGDFKIIELNGVSAEATHIYDPEVSLLDAYRAMYTQWRIAFEIGAKNRELGAKPMSTTAVLALIRSRFSAPSRDAGRSSDNYKDAHAN